MSAGEVGLRREAARRRLAGESPRAIARDLGRTRQWVAKWAARYHPHDPAWAEGRSRAPRRVANRTAADIEAQVLAVRARRRRTRGRINQLGNLTLVTKPLNSSLSHSPWQANDPGGPSKRQALADASVLLINQRLVQHETWNEKRIDERGADLAERILRTWPGPDHPCWPAKTADDSQDSDATGS